jgi:hypothetical protein
MTSETYEIYRYVFLGGAILAGIMLVVTVLVFFKLKIADVIGYFTGANKRKAVEQIKLNNENAEDKFTLTGRLNRDRRRVTDKISPSGNVVQQYQAQMRGIDTTKIQTQELPQEGGETSVLQSGETSVLDAAGETSVLNVAMPAGETSVLDVSMQSAPQAGETAVLSDLNSTLDLNGTLDLNMGQTGELAAPQPQQPAFFEIEYEITYIHTAEVIPQEAV